MLTKKQYVFLKHFKHLAEKSKSTNEQLCSLNREKIEVNDFANLLMKHPQLCPAEPFKNEGDDALEDVFLIAYINETYLEKIGLKDCIQFYEPGRYGISQIGISKMDEYRLETLTKIKLPWIAIVISILAWLTAVASIAVSVVLNLQK